MINNKLLPAVKQKHFSAVQTKTCFRSTNHRLALCDSATAAVDKTYSRMA